jgi:predicted acylesterase/phospholipase RssA
VADHGLTLALGGSAAKGLAHIGVLKGLEEDGIEVAAIAGTSMGSIIGALTAQGLNAREMEALFGAIDWVRLGRIMVTSVSGAAFHDMLRETFGGILIEGWLRSQRAERVEGEISARVSRWESVFRSFHIMQHRLATCSLIDVPMIEPRVGRFGWFDFHRVDEIITTGYDAYRQWVIGDL